MEAVLILMNESNISWRASRRRLEDPRSLLTELRALKISKVQLETMSRLQPLTQMTDQITLARIREVSAPCGMLAEFVFAVHAFFMCQIGTESD